MGCWSPKQQQEEQIEARNWGTGSSQKIAAGRANSSWKSKQKLGMEFGQGSEKAVQYSRYEPAPNSSQELGTGQGSEEWGIPSCSNTIVRLVAAIEYPQLKPLGWPLATLCRRQFRWNTQHCYQRKRVAAMAVEATFHHPRQHWLGKEPRLHLGAYVPGSLRVRRRVGRYAVQLSWDIFLELMQIENTGGQKGNM